MAERLIPENLVSVATPEPFNLEKAVLREVRDDLLNGPLRDAHNGRDLSKSEFGLSSQAE